MKNEITIRHRKIANDQPIFIMAECGVTCNYDLRITKELIDVVHDSGADGITVYSLVSRRNYER